MIYLVSNQILSDSNKYSKITLEEALNKLCSLHIVGLDTETEGFDPYTKKLKTIQLGCFDFQIVFDCTTVNPNLLKSYLESDRIFVGWNLKFDLQFLYHHDIYPNKIFDGYLAEKLLYLGYPAGMHSLSLKTAGQTYCDIELDKSVRGQIIWAGLTPEVIEYSANDVKYLESIMNKQLELLKKENLLKAIEYENNFVFPLAYMEYCGIKLDSYKWQEKMKKDAERMNNALESLNTWLINNMPDSPYIQWVQQGDLFLGFKDKPDVIINWNSIKQLLPIFKQLGIEVATKDGETLDAKVLKPQKHKSDLIPLYLEYKEASKVTSTYGENFLKQINPVSKRIHTNYSQMGADTTRITSGGNGTVNLLNLPSDAETRGCFVAEEGNSWISIDYSGQETYIMASIADDKALIKELMEGSGDVHSLTAYIAFKEIPRETPIKDIKKLYHHYRQEAKGIEFAINYGGNADTISRNKGIPMEEAQAIYNNYMSGFTGLAKYQAFRRKDWYNKGYILLNEKSGHRVHIWNIEELKKAQESFKEEGFWNHYKDMKSTDSSSYTVQKVKNFFKNKSDYERKSINFPIQATGSMCLRVSLIKFWKYLKEQNLLKKVKLCVAPYDEINCEAPKDIAKQIADVLYNCMVEAGAFFCTKCTLDADVSTLPDGTLPNYWIH